MIKITTFILIGLLCTPASAQVNSEERIIREETEAAITFLIERDPHPLQNNKGRIGEIAAAITKAAVEYSVPPLLLVSMAWFESHYSPEILALKKVGPAGEKGLLQVGKQALKNCPHFVDTVEGQALCGARWLQQGINDCGGDVERGLTMYANGTTCDKGAVEGLPFKVNRRVRLWRRLEDRFGN